MTIDIENPFSVTKATEFTDFEINEYWVDFNANDKESIISLLNPSEYLPKYILGSKGSGKTHILRYFSYPIQKIRKQGSIESILKDDKYIGMYSVLDGLNSSRFIGKGIDDDSWKSIFEYYFELYIVDVLLHTINDVFNRLQVDNDIEQKITTEVIQLLYHVDEYKNASGISDIIKILNSLRRQIDLEIINAPFTRKLNYDHIKIMFSPGELIFGIPNIIQKHTVKLQNVKFIYILDEYEKLFEWQKIFINTLVWDKKIPCSFWVGARKYGYTTRLTKSGEEMKPGSEFQPVDLDSVIRKNEELYQKFAEALYLNRLKKFYTGKSNSSNADEIAQKFKLKFEQYSDDKLISELKEKFSRKEYKHIKNLRDNLTKGIKKKSFNIVGIESEIEPSIISILEGTDNDPLEQKYKIYHFYKLWYDSKSNVLLKSLVDELNEEYRKYKEKQESKFANIKEKFKKDFLAQLTSENKIKNVCYSGIEDFIDISWGNPRSFILILKKTIELSRLRGEKPLEDGSVISLETQYLAIYDTARWFYEDAEIIGEKGKNLYKAITFLAELFRIYRFSDKPTETSPSSFNYRLDEISENALNYIKLAELHSLIVEVETGRKEKNSGRIEKLYQLNKTLAPLWNLPTIRRGTLSLDKPLAEAIFDPDKFENFDSIYKEIKNSLNAPSFCKKEQPNSNPSLFD